MEKLLKLLLVILMSFIGVLFHGWIMMTVWNWYIPTIFGLPAISYGMACGLEVIALFVTKYATSFARLKASYSGTVQSTSHLYDLTFKKNDIEASTGEVFSEWFSNIIQSSIYLFMAWVLNCLLL